MRNPHRAGWLVVLLGLTISSAQAADRSSDSCSQLRTTFDRTTKAAAVFGRNIRDIVQQTPNELKKTGKSNYSWNWLVSRYDSNRDGVIVSDELPQAEKLLKNLDRDWDGRLTAVDFDWSDDGVLDRQKETTFALFRTADKDSNGQITAKEWNAIFAEATKQTGALNDTQFEQLLFAKLAEMRQKRNQTLTQRARDRWGRLTHLYESGKLFSDGPEPGEIAPDFVLKSPDGLETVKLSSFRGKKPVVLIFGSFT